LRYRLDASIPWPRADVVAVQRDRVARLAAYLPSVRSVLETSRTTHGATTTVTRTWSLAPQTFPPGLRGLLPEDALGFHDTLTYDGHAQATFEAFPLRHADAVRCLGKLTLHDDGDGTLLEIDGEVSLTPRAVAHLPARLRERGAGALERAIITVLRAQLTRGCQATQAVLDDEW